jgi:NAD(P)H-dependent FMN reductase
MILIISSSLNPDSNSRILAREAQRVLERDGHPVTTLDLRDHPLPMCDGGPAYGHPSVARVSALLHAASTILVATPIYNYDATGALKNLIELTGDAWENKVVGFLCAAAGMSSYMSIMALANSLMLDFRSLILPRFVYATGNAFSDDRITDDKILERVAELAVAAAKLDRQLKAA